MEEVEAAAATTNGKGLSGETTKSMKVSAAPTISDASVTAETADLAAEVAAEMVAEMATDFAGDSAVARTTSEETANGNPTATDTRDREAPMIKTGQSREFPTSKMKLKRHLFHKIEIVNLSSLFFRILDVFFTFDVSFNNSLSFERHCRIIAHSKEIKSYFENNWWQCNIIRLEPENKYIAQHSIPNTRVSNIFDIW